MLFGFLWPRALIRVNRRLQPSECTPTGNDRHHHLVCYSFSFFCHRSSYCAISKAAATVGYATNAEPNATNTKRVFFLHFLAYKQVHFLLSQYTPVSYCVSIVTRIKYRSKLSKFLERKCKIVNSQTPTVSNLNSLVMIPLSNSKCIFPDLL